VAVSARALDKPKGPVILTISGQISQRNAGEFAEFDAAMIGALAVAEITTATPWNKTPVRFSGPTLNTVLTAVGAHGKVLRMIALDKYEVNVPIGDVARFAPLLARRANGQELKIRSQGPLFMVYPFDSDSILKNDSYASRAIWQLQRIVVE
jgi:hypothetical protein